MRATLAFPWLGTESRTSVGIAPGIATRASDVDTFFLSSGDVVTSGTGGGVRWHAWSLSHAIDLTPWRGWMVGVRLGYRQARADFDPDDVVVTHTQPPSATRAFTTARETTWARVIESGLQAHRAFPLGERWRAHVAAEALPITRARLDISLPDKYPGQLLKYGAFALGARARVSVEREWTRILAGIEVSADGARGYRASSRYGQRAIGVAGLITTVF